MRPMLLILPLVPLMGLAGCSTTDLPKSPDELRWPFEMLAGNTAERAVHRTQDEIFPDERREGILYLVDHRYGRREPYTELYRELAALDPDYTVRAMAVRALNIARDTEASQIYRTALGDPAPLVRLEGIKALNNMPDPAAVPQLLQMLGDTQQPRDIRIAAAQALRHYRRLDVARVLINQLSSREFAVAWQSLQSLVAMTGENHGYDEGAWLAYLTRPNQPLG